jgi:DNA repair exonuclease SbcCD ATPase subunit
VSLSFDTKTLECRIDDEVKAQRQSKRLEELEAAKTELSNRVKSLETVISDFTRQRVEFEREKQEKDQTIDQLVQEYSDLSGKLENAEQSDQVAQPWGGRVWGLSSHGALSSGADRTESRNWKARRKSSTRRRRTWPRP